MPPNEGFEMAANMTHEAIYDFMRARKLAVISSIGPRGEPQSALVGFAVSPNLEIVFDTLSSSRKYRNLKRDSSIAIVFGWEGETTIQYEGQAGEPLGDELHRAKDIYFATWPDGRERETWPGIAYFLVRPKWLRYSDFDTNRIEELWF
jgi:pyridoxine/pyridoxamine 5'-phosphate oxidase